MWVDIISIVAILIAAYFIGRERDKHKPDPPGKMKIEVKETER